MPKTSHSVPHRIILGDLDIYNPGHQLTQHCNLEYIQVEYNMYIQQETENVQRVQ